TRSRMGWEATKLAIEHGVNAESLRPFLEKMRPAAERRFVHIEWRKVAPKAPGWSPLKRLRAPVVAVGNKPRRWDEVLWRKKLMAAEVRVQKRQLFPRAPKWSPLHDLKFYALRATRKTPKSKRPMPPHHTTHKSRSRERGPEYSY